MVQLHGAITVPDWNSKFHWYLAVKLDCYFVQLNVQTCNFSLQPAKNPLVRATPGRQFVYDVE